MKITILHESGYEPALLGLGLSHGITSDMALPLDIATLDRLYYIARKLATTDGGHNKFLESIAVWLDIDAPRFWWSEFDTYRVGMTKQSESTMHTLGKRKLLQEDFEYPIEPKNLAFMNDCMAHDCENSGVNIEQAKNFLPEGFLQRRIVCTNYKALRGVILQRRNHRLPQWHIFIDALKGLEHSEFLPLEN